MRSLISIATICAVSLLLASPVYSQRAELDPKVEELWQAALTANPRIEPQKEFYKNFATAMLPILKDFRGFIAVLRKKEEMACDTNLLCREPRLVPGFRLGEHPTAIDFIRYVRTSTCYGFLPDEKHQLAFLDEIEKAMRMSKVTAEVLLPKSSFKNDSQAHFVFYELANLRDRDDDLFVKISRRFRELPKLLTQAGAGRGKQRGYAPPLDPLLAAAAYTTCEKAYGKPPYRQ